MSGRRNSLADVLVIFTWDIVWSEGTRSGNSSVLRSAGIEAAVLPLTVVYTKERETKELSQNTY